MDRSLRHRKSSVRTKNEVDALLSGMPGYTLRRLLVPVLELKARWLFLRRQERYRRKNCPPPTAPQLFQFLQKHPVWSKFPEPTLRELLAQAVFRVFDAGDIIVYKDEPAVASGIFLFISGTATPTVVGGAHSSAGGGSPTRLRSEHSSAALGLSESSSLALSGSGTSRRASTHDRDELVAPFALGLDTVLVDEPHRQLIKAASWMEAYIIPFSVVEQHVKAFMKTSTVAPSVLRILRPLRESAFAAQFPHSEFLMQQSWITHKLGKHATQVFLSRLAPRTYFSGQVLCKKGEVLGAIIFLRRGSVRVCAEAPSPIPILLSPMASARNSMFPMLSPRQSTQEVTASTIPSSNQNLGAGNVGASGAGTSRPPSGARAMSLMPPQAAVATSAQVEAGDVSRKLSSAAPKEEVLWPLISIGEMSMVFGEKATSTIEAISTCDCWVLTKSDFDQFLSSVPSAQPMINDTAVRLRSRWLAAQKASSTVRIIREALQSIPYLENAPSEVFDKLIEVAEPKVFTMHTSIISASTWNDALTVIARGVALTQHRSKRKKKNRFSVGSVLGASCVVEHRSLIPICALTMVDVWSIPRNELMKIVTKFGLKAAATAYSYKLIELEYKEFGESLPDHFGRPVDVPEEKKVVPKSSHVNRGVHLTLDSPVSPAKGGHASPRSPSSPNLSHAAEAASGNAKDESALDFLIDVLEPDINRGKAEKQTLFSELSRIPTRRHGRLASARGPADGSKRVLDSAGNILLRHDHHTARSQDGPVTPRHGQAPFRLDHLEQRTPTHQGSRERKPGSPINFRFKGATSPRNSPRTAFLMSDLTDGPATPKSSRLQVHKLPYIYVTVEATERIGLCSPWLLQLLGRDCLVPGYLEGSTPLEGTMEDYYEHWARVRARQIELMDSEDSSQLPPPTLSPRIETPPHPPVTPYRPVNPHSYAPVLPQVITGKTTMNQASRMPPSELWNATSEGLVDHILTKGTAGLDMTGNDKDDTGKPKDFFQEEWEKLMSPPIQKGLKDSKTPKKPNRSPLGLSPLESHLMTRRLSRIKSISQDRDRRSGRNTTGSESEATGGTDDEASLTGGSMDVDDTGSPLASTTQEDRSQNFHRGRRPSTQGRASRESTPRNATRPRKVESSSEASQGKETTSDTKGGPNNATATKGGNAKSSPRFIPNRGRRRHTTEPQSNKGTSSGNSKPLVDKHCFVVLQQTTPVTTSRKGEDNGNGETVGKPIISPRRLWHGMNVLSPRPPENIKNAPGSQ
jgi:CRP-like cAMP-binding protein